MNNLDCKDCRHEENKDKPFNPCQVCIAKSKFELPETLNDKDKDKEEVET